MKPTSRAGFTLLEIMIVVSIIGFLAGMGIPSFIRARRTAQQNSCINNLRQLAAAQDQWAMENYANNGDDVQDSDLVPYLKRGFPTCPAAGTYTVDVVGVDPTCNVSGHTL
jgi:type IV pilus assembly protein PilA